VRETHRAATASRQSCVSRTLHGSRLRGLLRRLLRPRLGRLLRGLFRRRLRGLLGGLLRRLLRRRPAVLHLAVAVLADRALRLRPARVRLLLLVDVVDERVLRRVRHAGC